MVKIVDMDGCGGSLIAPGVVLSAGHCGNYDDEEVSVGAYNRGDGESRTVLETRFHPNYDDDVDNDFMLLRLNTPVNSVETVKVNDNSGKPNDGQDLTVLGLGDLEEDGNSPNTLHDVVVQAVSDNDCEDAYGSSVDSDIMFCAGMFLYRSSYIMPSASFESIISYDAVLSPSFTHSSPSKQRR